tara:strand:+ start:847 stop:1140 length:294 start_codon:yes stop_codon:yes gene_type:complete
MSWKSILKANVIARYKDQIHRDLDRGNVQIQMMPHKKTFYDNGTLVIGGDILGQGDPKQVLEAIKPEFRDFIVEDANIPGVPGITVTSKPKGTDLDY